MDSPSLLRELYDRIPPLVKASVEHVGLERLIEAPSPGKNSIAWLVWHLVRIQDHHISAILGEQQIWITQNWAPRFGLEPDPSNTGYGHSPEQVARVRPESADVLLGYFEPVEQRTRTMLDQLSPVDLDRVVDHRWDPPVTMGVRLISVADDSLQHLGQAAYVRGLFNL